MENHPHKSRIQPLINNNVNSEIVFGFIEPPTSDFAGKSRGDFFIRKIKSSEQKISLNKADIQGDTIQLDFLFI